MKISVLSCLEVINMLMLTASSSELKKLTLINHALYTYEHINRLSKGIVERTPKYDNFYLTEEKQIELLIFLQDKLPICNEYEADVVKEIMSIIKIILIKKR